MQKKKDDIITDHAGLRTSGDSLQERLSFDLQVFPEQLIQAAELAANHPDTPIILDHAGIRSTGTKGNQRLAEGMQELGRHPNVAMKISALGTNDHHWTEESIRIFVLETIRIFGPERTMFGSNFPVDSLYSSFRALRRLRPSDGRFQSNGTPDHVRGYRCARLSHRPDANTSTRDTSTALRSRTQRLTH